MQQLHSAPISGHLAFNRTYNKIHERFYWLNMREEVELFCRECMECGARKNPHEYGKAPLKQIETTYPFKQFKQIDTKCNAMGIDKRRTSPYHPECDGMVERFNRTLLDMLAMYANDYHSDWDMWIPHLLG
jgi:hypothetical protein